MRSCSDENLNPNSNPDPYRLPRRGENTGFPATETGELKTVPRLSPVDIADKGLLEIEFTVGAFYTTAKHSWWGKVLRPLLPGSGALLHIPIPYASDRLRHRRFVVSHDIIKRIFAGFEELKTQIAQEVDKAYAIHESPFRKAARPHDDDLVRVRVNTRFLDPLRLAVPVAAHMQRAIPQGTTSSQGAPRKDTHHLILFLPHEPKSQRDARISTHCAEIRNRCIAVLEGGPA